MPAPMLPAAPGRLSTTTDWPHASVICGPMRRARMSDPPPAENGVSTRIGRLGYLSCAGTGAAVIIDARAAKIVPPISNLVRIQISPRMDVARAHERVLLLIS